MDTRTVYSIAVIFALIVGGYYYLSGKSQKLDVSKNQNLNSSATGILVVQTRENGQLYARATADHLIQNKNADQAEVSHLSGKLFENGKDSIDFTAQKGFVHNNYKDYELSGGVVLTKIADEKTPSLTLKTEQLQGNSDTNQIQTDKLVTMSSPQGQFVSQGLKADLDSGQYEFFKIRGIYDTHK